METLNEAIKELAVGGFETTCGFTLYNSSAEPFKGDSLIDFDYDSKLLSNWYRLGLDSSSNISGDAPDWFNSTDSSEAPHSGTTDYQGVGKFSGAYMPHGITNMFNYDSAIAGWSDSDEINTSGVRYSGATGSYDMAQLKFGDQIDFELDLNITPKVTGTHIETALILAKRDTAGGTVTGHEIIAGDTMVFGRSSVVGYTFHKTIRISHSIRSEEDLHSSALIAVKSDNTFYLQPLNTKFSVRR